MTAHFLGKGTSMMSGRIKLVLRTQTLPLIFSLYNRNTTKWSEHEAFIQYRSVDILFSRIVSTLKTTCKSS